MGPTVLPWLNSLPEVRAVLERDFAGVEVSPANLSNWRAKEYEKWCEDQLRVQQIGQLADLSFRLAEASGGNLSEGAVAVAGGQILDVLENIADLPVVTDKGDPRPSLTALIESITLLRGTEIATSKLGIERAKVAQKDKALDLETARFQRQTAEMFLKWWGNKQAQEIAAGNAAKEVKIDDIRALMFGRRPAQQTQE